MKEFNDVELYEPGEMPPIPAGLDPTFQADAPYGFKIVEVAGKKAWEVATEEDYREAEAQRLGIERHQVQITDLGCHLVTPISCTGGCGDEESEMRCWIALHPILEYYYCVCAHF